MIRCALTIALTLLPATLFATPADDLLQATRNNDPAEVLRLLSTTSSVNATGTNDMSVLHVAAGMGYTNLTHLALQHGADVDARNALGKTPLMLAAQEGHGDIVALLLEAGARTDLQDNAGATALTWARGYGHGDIVDALEPVVTPQSSPVATWKWLVTFGAALLSFVALYGQDIVAPRRIALARVA